MANRMRYGPRHGPGSVASATHQYDSAFDPLVQKGKKPWATPGTLKHVLGSAKGRANNPKTTKISMPRFSFSAPKEDPNKARVLAEQRMVERIDKAIELLQFGLVEMNEAPTPTPSHRHLVNPISVGKAIGDLQIAVVGRTKRRAPILEGDM